MLGSAFMVIVVQLASLAFEKRGEMARPVHEQSRIEVKGEKLTFHLIYIL